jgi:hypothetical protein
MTGIRVFGIGLCFALTSAPLAAQSLFNATGAGLPLEALDARTRALGNVGIGLQGASVMPTDPAAAGRLVVAAAVVTGQPTWADYSDSGSGQTGTFQGSRFPLFGIAYPAFSGMVTMHLESFLDQRFEGERPVTVDLLDGTADAVDRFTQEGAVSKASIGFARRLGERASVGLSYGRYTGSLARQLVREFTSTEDVQNLADVAEDFVSEGRWRYSGHSVTGGVALDIGAIARVAGSFTWSTSLDATASDETSGSDGSFALPLQLRVGASGVLAPGLVITASASRANWSVIGDDLLRPVSAQSVNAYGVGLELSRTRFLGRTAPLRLGFRRGGLPFPLGTDEAHERVFSGGIGIAFSETQGLLLAGADFAIERGLRSSGSVTENFWRVTASLHVSGL